MSKRQTIKEQKAEIWSLENDYAQAIRERDSATRELDKIGGMKRLEDAAKKEAAIQEKIDGIKAGLIPVEELRRAFDSLEIDAEGTAFVTYRFDKHADRVQKALSDVLTAKPQPQPGGYVDEETKKLAISTGLFAPRDFAQVGYTSGVKRGGQRLLIGQEDPSVSRDLLRIVNTGDFHVA